MKALLTGTVVGAYQFPYDMRDTGGPEGVSRVALIQETPQSFPVKVKFRNLASWEAVAEQLVLGGMVIWNVQPGTKRNEASFDLADQAVSASETAGNGRGDHERSRT